MSDDDSKNQTNQGGNTKRDAGEGDALATAIQAALAEAQSYRKEQNKSENKKIAIDRTAARAAMIAAVLSAVSLIAFIVLSLMSGSTLNGQLHMMELDERPWVSLQDAPQVTGNLHIEPSNNPHNATIGLNLIFTLKNTGKSPAVDVDVHIAFVDEFAIGPKITPLDKQKALCEPLRTVKAHSGITVFPGSSPRIAKSRYMEPGDLEISEKDSEKTNGVLQMMPVVVGCIDYRFPYAPDEHHQTAFIYRIMRKAQSIPDGVGIQFDTPFEVINADQLQLDEGVIDTDTGAGRTD